MPGAEEPREANPSALPQPDEKATDAVKLADRKLDHVAGVDAGSDPYPPYLWTAAPVCRGTRLDRHH